ncbi:MAG: vitamin B12 dependent-methionine synthase activation domain-containing protein [Candidatus Margulisbacteria bacterium]|nr:vitamin B12 dependent-methionine synthase activation domain-containing protein [Candidatus Margulisiibacteriota bacterium]
MSQKKIIEPEKFIPFINKQVLFKTSWGLKNNTPSTIEELEKAFLFIKKTILTSDIKGLVFYDTFKITKTNTAITFPEHNITWEFPTINKKNIASSTGDKIVLQVVTLGKEVLKKYEELENLNNYSNAYYFHGFTTWMAEALAQYNHNTMRNELGSRVPPERYSFGYSLCPDMSMQKDLFSLLQLNNSDDVSLTESYMMYPEQSTSALILH